MVCPKGQLLWTNPWAILRNIVSCYQNRNPSRTFCRNDFISKHFKKFSMGSHFLIKTQDYSIQPRTILNSITDSFMRVFSNSYTKNFGKHPENLCSMMEYILQPTAELKTPLQILFLKRSERKECSNISKISGKYLQNCSFSLTL